MTARTTPRRRSAAQSSQTRTEILDRAAELFGTKGFAGTTVREIAEACGMMSGSLYYYFRSKEEILAAIFLRYVDGLEEAWEELLVRPVDGRSGLEYMLRISLETAMQHTAAAKLLTHEWATVGHTSELAERWNRIERRWIKVISSGIEDGWVRPDLSPLVPFSLAMDVIRGLSGWYTASSRLSSAEILEGYVAIVMQGVTVPPVSTDEDS
jgi:AcrR family transcriptional regulator